MIEAARYSSLAEQHAAHLERRRRLMGLSTTKTAQPASIAPAKRVRMELPAPKPLWSRKEIWFDYHVLMFKAESSPLKFMTLVCIQAGESVDELIGAGRRPEIVLLRFSVAYSLTTKFGMSYSAIGRLMEVDHTSVRYWVHRYCESHGVPIPQAETALSTQDAATAKEMFLKGYSIPDIAEAFDVSAETIRTCGRIDGWYITPKEANYRAFKERANIAEVRAYAVSGLRPSTIALKVKAPLKAVERYMREHSIVTAMLPGRKRGG